MIDPIVEEVRKARKKHAERFNFNLHEICEDLKKIEKNSDHVVKSLPAKRIQKATVS